MVGGRDLCKKIPSMKVVDIAKAIAPDADHKIYRHSSWGKIT